MRRPREAVDAAMLAASIGIDRAVEANIGRIVPSYDGAAGVLQDARIGPCLFLGRERPAVIEPLARGRLITARTIADGAASLDGPVGYAVLRHGVESGLRKFRHA